MAEVIRDLDRTAAAGKDSADVGYTLGVVTRNGLAWTESYGFADATGSLVPGFAHLPRRPILSIGTEYRLLLLPSTIS
jgi:hypothetical protein